MAGTSTRSVIRWAAVVAAVIFPVVLIGVGGPPQAVTSVVTFHPAASDFQFITASETPPTQAQSAPLGRPGFTPSARQHPYNPGPPEARGRGGRGISMTIGHSVG